MSVWYELEYIHYYLDIYICIIIVTSIKNTFLKQK